MADKRILTGRQWHIDGKWFAPQKYLRDNFTSIVYCDYMEMTSSAGEKIPNGVDYRNLFDEFTTAISNLYG